MGDTLNATKPHGQHPLRALQRLARALLVDTDDPRVVRRLRHRPTTSRSLSIQNGSLESLTPSARYGCRPKSWRQRATLLLEMPVSAATVRTLRCVEPLVGLVGNVVLINSELCALDCSRQQAVSGYAQRTAVTSAPRPTTPTRLSACLFSLRYLRSKDTAMTCKTNACYLRDMTLGGFASCWNSSHCDWPQPESSFGSTVPVN